MTQRSSQSRQSSLSAYFVGIGFLIVAGVLIGMNPRADVPLVEQPAVRPEQIKPGAFRVALTDPPMVNLGTYDQRCNDCHSLFENDRDSDRALTQHTNIVLEHGNNDACLNCHDKADREKLTLRGGGTVGYDHVEQLCAQCHGPIYRDWQNGTHGKIIGYWNTDLGPATKLKCTQCHDPHHPAYRPMAPLPGPNTLRMGDQHNGHGEAFDERNPLQRWRLLDGTESHNSGHGGDHE
ncbi:MAG: hypothetical protein ACWA5W_06405 [Phycisphaerales bacterium]